MVRYYGFYSNVNRGKRKKAEQDDPIPSILEPEGSSSEFRKNWARLPALARLMGYEGKTRTYLNYKGLFLLRWNSRSGPGIQKIYEVDPLTCPKCRGRMKVIAFIENEEVIKKILKHLGLWERKARPPPSARIWIDPSDSQLPPDEEDLYRDPEYPAEVYAA